MILDFNGIRPRIHPSAYIAPTAVIIGDVEIGEQASVWFGAVLRGDGNRIVVGPRSNVQDNAVVHINHENGTFIGADVTVGHCAVLEGCRIGDGALIGMNACVLDGAEVGARAVVAAGSVVREGAVIAPAVLAAGVPAQVKRELSADDLKMGAHASEHYVELSRQYLGEALRPGHG
jgi:carbonic anhydrase/acetyltransferase-like protein (isoleucine patch superfamily)